MPLDDFDFLGAIQKVVAKARVAPSCVALSFEFAHSVRRSKKVQTTRETICVLWETGLADAEVDALIEAQVPDLGCSWLEATPGGQFKSLIMKPARVLRMASLVAKDPSNELRGMPSHEAAAKEIQDRARAIAEAFARMPKVSVASRLDSSDGYAASADALSDAFSDLMRVHEAKESKKTLEAETPEPAAKRKAGPRSGL